MDGRLEKVLSLILGVVQAALFVTAIFATARTLRTRQQASYFDAVQFSTLHILAASNVRDNTRMKYNR